MIEKALTAKLYSGGFSYRIFIRESIMFEEELEDFLNMYGARWKNNGQYEFEDENAFWEVRRKIGNIGGWYIMK